MHIYIDIIGPLPSTAGFQYCLTAVDRFTHRPEVFPITDQWTETLKFVLHGIRSAYKENLNASTAELDYDETIHISGEFLMPTPRKADPQQIIQRLRRRMNDLRPNPATRRSTQASFIHKDLKDSTHVFLRQDTARRTLQPPYSGPQKVIPRTDKTFKIVVRAPQVSLTRPT